jgi:hypothetical protein
MPLDSGGIELEPEPDPPHTVIANRLMTTTAARRDFMLDSTNLRFVRVAKSGAHERFSGYLTSY